MSTIEAQNLPVQGEEFKTKKSNRNIEAVEEQMHFDIKQLLQVPTGRYRRLYIWSFDANIFLMK